MNSYYVMIRFEGSYVDGYFVPQANDEEHALKQLKKLMVAQIILARNRVEETTIQGVDISYTESHLKRLKTHYRSLKHPWRHIKERWPDMEHKRKEPVVSILNWNLPIEAGFWLKMVGTETHLCNLPGANWEPRPKITG